MGSLRCNKIFISSYIISEVKCPGLDVRSWQAGEVQISPQSLAVWWVALPWPILPVPAVLLALCRVVVFFQRKKNRHQ